MRRTLFFLWAAMCACKGGGGERAPATVDRGSLLLITIDTLRADHLPAYGYQGVATPTLDALADTGVVFEDAHAHAPITLPSHASIMTGLFPPEHGVRSNGSFKANDKMVTMAELFKERGYRTGAFVSAFVLDSRYGLDQGFDTYDDDLNDGRLKWSKFGVKDRRAETTIPPFLKWLDQTPDAPFFAWVHLYDPHYEYAPPEPFRSRYRNQYDAEIAYTDHQLGRMFAALKKRGVTDKLTVIVTSDHGESLGEHGESTHSLFVYQATQHVPLIIHRPKQLAGRVSGLVRHVDLLPTAAAMFDLRATKTSGRSLLPAMQEQEPLEPVFSYAESYLPKEQFGWSPLYSLRDTTHKFIQAPTSEFYELEVDPNEVTNRFAASSKQRKLADTLALWRGRMDKRDGTADKEELDDEARAKLSALGYLGGGANPDQAGADPKDMVGLHEAREKAHRHMDKGEYARAIEVMQKTVQQDRKNPSLHNDLASCYAELGKWDEAEAAYKTARGLASHRVGPDIGLTKVYFKGRKDYAAAERELKRAFQKTPDDPALWGLKGDLLHERGKYKDAVVAYKKALDAGDQSASYLVGYASALNLTGQLEESQRIIELAIRLDPMSPIAHFNHGVILERRGLVGAAEGAYRHTLRLAPDMARATSALSRLIAEMGHLAQAEMLLRRAIARAPKDFTLHYELGSLLLRQGKVKDGTPFLERAVALAPKAVAGRTNLGFAYEQAQRLEDAFAQYGELSQLFRRGTPGHCDALLRLARVRARQKRLDEAGQWRQRHSQLCGG